MTTLPPTFALDEVARTLHLDPRDPAFVQDPWPAYRELLQRAPVFFWRDYGYWVFARHDDVGALLRDPQFGRQVLHVASRAELGWPEPPAHLAPFVSYERHALLELEPPEHARLRALVNRPFLTRVTDRLRPRLEALAHRLVDGFGSRGEVELLEAYATPLPLLAICDVMGIPEGAAGELLRWSNDIVAMYQARRDAAVERRAAEACVAFGAFVRARLAERRAAPAADLLGALAGAENAGDRLSDDEIVSTAMLFLIAGHEATVHAIGNGVKALLERGLDPRPALAEPERAARLVEELLRFDTPLHLFTRFVLQDTEIAGIRFARGERIGLLLGAANHDAARFERPDELRPERAPNPHVSFGGGIHFCVGAPLARMELQVGLRVLFERLPRLALAEPPRWRDTYHFRGLEALRLRGAR
jgi:unspecific monooxygenase